MRTEKNTNINSKAVTKVTKVSDSVHGHFFLSSSDVDYRFAFTTTTNPRPTPRRMKSESQKTGSMSVYF